VVKGRHFGWWWCVFATRLVWQCLLIAEDKGMAVKDDRLSDN